MTATDPTCNHVPRNRVTAGSFDGAHASIYVCDREACIDDAKVWAQAMAPGQPIVVVPLPTKRKET